MGRSSSRARGSTPVPAGKNALPEGLTARELDVLRLLAAGASNRAILGVRRSRPMAHILRKLETSSRSKVAAGGRGPDLSLIITIAKDRPLSGPERIR